MARPNDEVNEGTNAGTGVASAQDVAGARVGGATSSHVAVAPSRRAHGLNVLRGALIGTVETVPGVSGGTVALVVGVYETIITSAGHVLSGVRRAVVDTSRRRGLSGARAEFGRADWHVLVPLLVGMVVALVAMARLIEGWVEDSPVQSRALFFGLVLASLWVPFTLVGRWTTTDAVVAVVAATLAFIIVSIPPGDVEPNKVVIVLAAAIAVSALVLPGLSGSFLLLTLGLYEETLAAVNDRDLGYLAFFALGAVAGLASFVKLLQWLLEHRRRITLVVLTGVMAGCLRALWPWQDEDRALGMPGDHLAEAAVLGAAGFLAVLGFLVVERRWTAQRRQA